MAADVGDDTKHPIKRIALATATTALLAGAALAAPQRYELDTGHSQVTFSLGHLGFSTIYGMFSGFEGVIEFDAEDPAASSVAVSMPITSTFTGWKQRDAHFMSADFFDAAAADRGTVTVPSAKTEAETCSWPSGQVGDKIESKHAATHICGRALFAQSVTLSAPPGHRLGETWALFDVEVPASRWGCRTRLKRAAAPV